MKSVSRRILMSLLVVPLMVTMIVAPSRAHADPTREFMMSAAYGALAGTLVGAATLAFSDRPGDNLNKVARGASVGLYVGILLGLYVVYGGPSEDSDAAEQLKRQTSFTAPKVPSLLVAPIIGDRGLEGAQASYSVLHF
jgi:hypothetical protein